MRNREAIALNASVRGKIDRKIIRATNPDRSCRRRLQLPKILIFYSAAQLFNQIIQVIPWSVGQLLADALGETVNGILAEPTLLRRRVFDFRHRILGHFPTKSGGQYVTESAMSTEFVISSKPAVNNLGQLWGFSPKKSSEFRHQ